MLSHLVVRSDDDTHVEMSALRAASASPAASPSAAVAVPSSRRKLCLSVQGMTCAACSGTIERALGRVRGVHSARVALLTERAEVVFDERILSAKDVISEIEDVGFEARESAVTSKGKILLLTSERMSEDKRAVITRAMLEHTGVLGVKIAPRATEPFHDVLEVEFDTDRHALSGPGGARPVVVRADMPVSATPASSSSASTNVADALGRFSVRALVASLAHYSLHIALVRNDGDLEARKAEIRLRREEELRTWRTALLQSLVFTIPTAVLCWLAPLVPSCSEALMAPLHRALTLKAFLLWILVTPVQFWVGGRFYRAAYKSLSHGSANMDVLVAMGSSAAYFYSLLVCILCLANDHYSGAVFFETSALLISIVLLGRWVEHVAKGKTSEALGVLMGLQAPMATLLHFDPAGSGQVLREEEVDVNLVQRDDVVLVPRGGKIPIDGIVDSDESSSVDESLLTGESMPVVKVRGSNVIGGTLNLEAPIRVRATGVGSDTVLFKIVEMVQDAQSSKAPIQAYADYVATIFVPVVVLLSLVTFILWYAACKSGSVPGSWLQDHETPFLFSFLFAISVLLISCPCSLGLATPTAVMVGTGVGASLGVLFKGGEPLERTGEADVVVFDKTGTLTMGKPSVNVLDSTLLRLNELRLDSDRAWWSLVGALAHESEHLMSRAMAAYARDLVAAGDGAGGVPTLLPEAEHFEAQSGGGCAGTVSGRRILIGNARFFLSQGVVLSADEKAAMQSVQVKGNIAVLVAIDGVLAGIVALRDAVKPEALGALRALRARGIEVFMLTGDNEVTARAVGEAVGLDADHVISQVTPADKADVVRRIQRLGRRAVLSTLPHVHTGEDKPLRVRAGLTSAHLMVRSPAMSPVASSQLLTPAQRFPEVPSSSDEDSLVVDIGPASDADVEGGSPKRVHDPSAPVVLMVGDGINDAAALASADVGVAIGNGSAIAVETADVVLMRSDLGDVVTAIDLSQETLARIRRNFTWACIYNVLSIPVAAGVFYPVFHVGLPPVLAAACMGLSSLSVIASSLWLKRYKKPVLIDGEGPSGRPQDSADLDERSVVRSAPPAGVPKSTSPPTSKVAGVLSRLAQRRASEGGPAYGFSSVPLDGGDEDELGGLGGASSAQAPPARVVRSAPASLMASSKPAVTSASSRPAVAPAPLPVARPVASSAVRVHTMADPHRLREHRLQPPARSPPVQSSS